MATRGIFEVDRFVTSEAVEIELPAASLPLRMLSGLIDLVVMLGVLLAITLTEPWLWVGQDDALLQALVIVLTVTLLVGLPVTQETLLRGRTIGKMATGLRTVREDTGPIGFRHALLRGLVGVIEVYLSVGGLALIVAATNERSRRLGDLLAGTYVVHERVRLHPPPPVPMPTSPPLAAWAGAVDLGVLPDGLALATRQFLQRTGTLTDQARVSRGTELYTDLVGRVSPAPPPGHHPEAVMAAVLAERARRDLERAANADQLRARVLGPDPL